MLARSGSVRRAVLRAQTMSGWRVLVFCTAASLMSRVDERVSDARDVEKEMRVTL